jgi:protein TonB
MTQAGYLQAKRMNPGALATAFIVEGAIIAAAVTWQIDAVPKIISEPTKVWLFPDRKPDEVKPTPRPTADPRPQIQPRDTTFPEEVIVDLPPTGGQSGEAVDQGPPEGGMTGTGTTTGPLIPAAPTIQPARARGNIRDLITSEDYPDAALRREETGTVRARLAIGAAGNVTGCAVIESSGSAALDSATCKVLKARARFTPAKDGSGQAVADSYVTPQIVWRLDG